MPTHDLAAPKPPVLDYRSEGRGNEPRETSLVGRIVLGVLGVGLGAWMALFGLAVAAVGAWVAVRAEEVDVLAVGAVMALLGAAIVAPAVVLVRGGVALIRGLL